MSWTVAWLADCDCRDAALRTPGWQPRFVTGPGARALAVQAGQIAYERGGLYWSFHANGEHLLLSRKAT